MKFSVKKLNFETGNVKAVVLNAQDASKMGQKAGDRLIIKKIDSKKIEPLIALLDVSHHDSIIAPGEIGIFLDTFKNIKDIESAKEISVVPAEPPESFKLIKKKIDGKKLNSNEINKIISDAISGQLSQIELASFITGVSINGMDNLEMTALTLAETNSGEMYYFGTEVYDKHSTKIHNSWIC